MGEAPSTKPYLIRALHQWCVDHGFTPYLAVFVTEQVQVPMDYVNNNEIVLNISPDACQNLSLDNDWISLKARFAGVPRDIFVPVGNVMAIYAKENGQGMSFPVERVDPPTPESSLEKNPTISKGRPSLKLVK
ncbi:MAG: ClpXP protease specificity-enhancing factor [Polynucleobacter sp.]|nr:MAG: ClpXP protease specificity-enhancing factor [Polynucleobacter sp.]